MQTNTFVKIPKKNDVVVGHIASDKVCFIDLDSFDNSSLSNAYERIGVVGYRRGKDVLIVNKEHHTSKQLFSRAWWYLTGMTLDGAEHTGTLQIRAASNSWASNIAKVITYTATTNEEFVTALNTAFAADSDMDTQDWYADIWDGKIRVHCAPLAWQQFAKNTASDGFTLTGSCPEIPAYDGMLRKHGGNGGWGAVCNVERAMDCFRPDGTNYNPSTDLTNIKLAQPVRLPAFLGISQHQSDHCALLRQTFGEGEEGWKKHIESCMPVVPTDYGIMGIRSGYNLTKQMASIKYTSRRQATPAPCCAAADYCWAQSTVCLPQGKWYLGAPCEYQGFIEDVKYGTNPSRNSDRLNLALNKLGGTAIPNNVDIWSCSRHSSDRAWFMDCCFSVWYNNNAGSSRRAVPLSLYRLKSN